MKIKRYAARDMRSALRAVQQEQGPDAVILSSHETADGIELVAAVDYDESLIQQSRRRPQRESDEVVDFDEPPPKSEKAAPPARVATSSNSSASNSAYHQALEQQIDALRDMLESRLDAVATNYHSASPARRTAHALISALGFRPAQASRMAQIIPEGMAPPAARKQVLEQLAAALPLGREDLLSRGGALALVGPTGVGKTTTAAKLAARHILKFGQGSVQLVGTDEYRIGAQEQLASYARIFGAPLHRVQHADELTDILRTRRSEELVLVDTAGIGGRDLILHQQFDLLAPQTRLHRALCLSAATSPADLVLQAQRFQAARPNCLILTKLDETQRIGQALSFVLEQALPMAYTSDGQQVPEDLHLPRAHDLIAMALDQRKNAAARATEDIRDCA